jgi:thiol-disulfide isomerase/thioredoxin
MAAVKALFDNMACREIGEMDGLRYYLCSYDADEYFAFLELGGVERGEPAYREEYKALMNQLDSLSVTLTGGAVLADAAETGSRLVFKTTDLDGKTVTSEEIFSDHKITMINLWATWCDPCKNELPALAEMAKDFEKKGGRIIGICLDAEDEETMAEGREILKEAGADYLNIAPFEGREDVLPNKYYPTTYFVDENGVLLDEVISGAQLSRYPLALEKLLGE